MLNITNELKAKLLAVQSAEEAAALMKADGQEITAEDAAKLWEEIERKRDSDGKELSPDELDAVSGGGRNWLFDGCAATVEEGSDCWGTDGGCFLHNISYDYFNASLKCPNYAGPHWDEEVSREVNDEYGIDKYGIPKITVTYRCKYCGRTYQESGVTGKKFH